MATSTTNLGLTKPSVNDAADIGVLNSNFDKIDTKCNPALFAPSGYGLGAFSTDSASLSDANTAIKSGWYRLSSSTANGIGSNCVIRVDSYGSNYCTQTAYLLSSQHNTFIQRQCVNGTWGEWEWVNPPMELGVEYRTTERWNGMPVYTKLVSCGAMPNHSTKAITVATGSEVKILRVSGYTGYTNSATSFEKFTLPFKTASGYEMGCHAKSNGSNADIVLYSSYDVSSFDQTYVTVWYVRT